MTSTQADIALPQYALSVRQPWAWAICHAGKHLENRTWGGWSHDLTRFRGPVCIHASSGMTRDEYDSARDFMAAHGVRVPPAREMIRGAIIGTAVVTGWTRNDPSFWFTGPGALVLSEMTALKNPIPCCGALGFFKWTMGGALAPPARWMQDKPPLSNRAVVQKGTLL